MSVSAERIAWLAPHGGMPAGGLLAWCRQRDADRSLVVVPTATARDLWRTRLSRLEPNATGPRVLSWSDLWTAIRRASADGPRVLDDAGRRLILERAIDACVRDGLFGDAADLVRTCGFRRALGAKIVAWSARWARPGPTPPEEATDEEWAVFRHVRRLTERARMTDGADLARWASRSSRIREFLEASGVAVLAILDVSRIGAAGWSVLRGLRHDARPLLVSAPGELEPGREALSLDVGWCRRRLESLGFELRPAPVEPRPAGLAAARRGLFRVGGTPAEDCEGVQIEGMPAGEGEVLAAARAVRAALAAGASPEDVVVLFPDWTEQAVRTASTLRDWGVPCSGRPGVPLERDAGVSCLLSVAALPIERWDARRVAEVLRHGRLAPRWDAPSDSESLAGAARATIECRAFRDLPRLLEALERRATRPPREGREARSFDRAQAQARSAHAALTALGRLFAIAAGTWDECVEQVDRLVETLGLDATDVGGAIERLRTALDEQGRLLAAIGEAGRVWSWTEFTFELRDVAREVQSAPEPPRAGTVRLATIDEAWGAEVPWRVVVGAAEGTFPTRAIVRSTWARAGSDHDWIDEAAAAREMRRFLDLACSTTRRLTVIHGAADEKGQPLLRAGFVEELAGLFAAEARSSATSEVRLLPPVLDEDLAVAPRERRVAALARALKGEGGGLVDLAMLPGARGPLLGIANGLRVIHFRARERFGHHDGVLTGDRTIRAIAEEFDRRAAELSPSQLETYALCPFRYYLRYVVGVQPAADEELQEDLSARGRALHRILEEFHQLLRLEGIEPGPAMDLEALQDRFARLIESQLAEGEELASELDACFRELDRERLTSYCRTYLNQYAEYLGSGARGTPSQFELRFGALGDLPPLRLGPDTRGRTIGLQGVVDRVDVIEADGERFFRVIDYKSGSVPGAKELKDGRALQLPLYTLAVERLHFADGTVRPAEMGYWGLKEGVGYRKLYPTGRRRTTMNAAAEGWSSFAERLELFIFALADRIRTGEFPVAPSIEDCERACDYRTTCRIRQLGLRGKDWDRRPTWDPSGEREP